MSRKNRPTAASWDSDEDLLQDDILGISAFQSSKEKDESDEELDEDALLGSDDEYSDAPVEKKPVPVAVPVKVEKTLTSTTASAIPIQTNYQTHVKANEHVEEYQHLESGPSNLSSAYIVPSHQQRVPSVAAFAGEDVIEAADPSELDGFENGAGNLVGVDQDVPPVDFGAGDISGQPLEGLGNEGYNHPVDDYESFQSQEETYEDKTIKGFDESSESEDEEKGRGRFISERSNIISIATTKPKTRTDIPDTLEISEEQQAQIDQFLNERNRRGGRRGYRGGNERGMRGGRQHVYGAWQDRSNMNSQQQASHQMSEQHKRTSHYQQQQQQQQPVVSSMSHTESEAYPITITGQGSYNASHSHPRNSGQHQHQQQQDSQQRHYQHHQIQQPPLLPSHPSQPASHQSHMYQHQSVASQQQHQHPAALSHHYTQPTSQPAPQSLAPPVSAAPPVQLTQGLPTHQQQGRKILINPHFRGAKLEAPTPPVISSVSALLPQAHQHYQPVPQQAPYVQQQQHTPDVWQTAAQPQRQHSYLSNSQPVMHSQTHYNPVTQGYQGAPQPIQSLAPPNQPPAVYPPSQQYQSAVPPRPVADQSMMFRQPPPHLPPAPQAPPSHFMSNPPQQPPPQSPQPHAPLHPSHIHPPLQSSIPPPHHNQGGPPPLQQSFQSRPQYQVQSAPHQPQPPSHQMPPPQHPLHHQQPGNTQKMHPAQNLHQRSLVNTPLRFRKDVQRKYQRIRGNLLVSPKRKRQEIQTQQNKNIKVLTTLPQVKLISDVDEPPNKIAKVSTHLKTLTQSDDSLDDETKSMREKLELQKRMRAEVIRRKELRRLMHAEQRRKDLHVKLAEQGLTLADITEEQKANFMEGSPSPNKQFGSVNRTLQPVLGKKLFQTTQGQTTMFVAGVKRTAAQQLMGRPVKQIKGGSGQMISQSQNTGQHLAGQQNKTTAQQTQAASNVILSEEQKNFYQKQYVPPHQQFQSASTSKKIKLVSPTKNLDQKTQSSQQEESKQMPGQSTSPKAKEQLQPLQKTPPLQPQVRPLRGAKSRVFQGRTLSSSHVWTPSPNHGQVFGQQRPMFPGPNQPRPLRMQGQLRPGQPSNQPRHQMPVGPRPPPPAGNIRHPSPTGLRHPSPGILRHPGLQGHPRLMRGQPHLMGPPRQPRTGQEQLRPLYPPGQQRFMGPGNQQRPMMLQGRGGIRGGMNLRGRGRGMLGRGGHQLPMAPPGDAPQQPSPQAQTKLPLASPKKGGKGPGPPVPNHAQPTAGGKKGLVRKLNQSGPMGGPPQGNPGPQDQKPHILRNPVNRQMRMQGPNMAGGPMKFLNPMGRGQPPQRPMGMGPNTRSAGKEQGRRMLLDGDSGKKATMIAVDNLSSSTTERTINQMAKSCGHVESLQLLKSQRKALIRFRVGDQAHDFFNRFHRHMLDLSHINVTVLPAS